MSLSRYPNYSWPDHQWRGLERSRPRRCGTARTWRSPMRTARRCAHALFVPRALRDPRDLRDLADLRGGTNKASPRRSVEHAMQRPFARVVPRGQGRASRVFANCPVPNHPRDPAAIGTACLLGPSGGRRRRLPSARPPNGRSRCGLFRNEMRPRRCSILPEPLAVDG